MFDWKELGGAPSDVKFLRFSGFFFLFFSNFGNPAKEHYRRYPETAISVNTFIVGLMYFSFDCLFLCLFF